MKTDKTWPGPLLDVFILSLVKQEVNTLYLLKREAGVSIGAASPALRRMEKNFLVILRQPEVVKGRGRKVQSRNRSKREYDVVPVSNSAPIVWLDRLREEMPTDTESVARIVALADAYQRMNVAQKALKKAIAERRKRTVQAPISTGRSTVAARYRSIVQACESAKAKAEAAALNKILKDLK
jgi:hypothetical protein